MERLALYGFYGRIIDLERTHCFTHFVYFITDVSVDYAQTLPNVTLLGYTLK